MTATDDSLLLRSGVLLLLAVAVGCPSQTPGSSGSLSEPGSDATTSSPPPAALPASDRQPSLSPSGPESAGPMAGQHLLWQQHQEAGRMAEAAQIASQLSRAGKANLDESLSLIAREQSFPPAKFAHPGPTAMSQAVWHASLREYEAALARLLEIAPASMTPNQLALQGRVLAEAQHFDALPNWIRQSDPSTRQQANFWATLGIWLGHHQQPHAAIGATLQAIRLNPTDQLSTQRVGNWLLAIDQEHDAELFYQRARLIAETSDLRDQWIDLHPIGTEAGNRPDIRDQKARLAGKLAKAMMEAGRPFESFQWRLHQLDVLGPTNAESEASRSSNAAKTRALIHQQMQTLANTPDLAAILAEEHWLQLRPEDFPFQTAFRTTMVEQESNAALASRAIAASKSNDPANNIPRLAENLASYQPRLSDLAAEVGLNFRFRPRHRPSVPSEVNVAADMSTENESLRMHEALGSGIGVIDYDRDGWPDIVFGQGASEPPALMSDRSDALFRNLAGQFIEQTEATGIANFGYSFGIACGDINQDGFDDLLIATLGVNQMYVNNGDGTFTNDTDSLGDQTVEQHDGAFTTSVAIADLNGDQLPDLYEANYVERNQLFVRLPPDQNGRIPQKTPRSLFAQPDRIWVQSETQAWQSTTIDESVARAGTSLGVIVGEFSKEAPKTSPKDSASKSVNQPSTNKIFVGNDARPNHLLRFDASQNRWQEIANLIGLANTVDGLPSASMGIAADDLDRRGGLDLFITNFSTESVSLYLQDKSGSFSDQCVRQRLDSATRPMVGFGCKAIDLNRDGWLDVCLVNGHIDRMPGEPYEMPPQCFLSSGFAPGQSSDLLATPTMPSGFVSVIPDCPTDYWTTPALGRTMAKLDFDRDQRMDLVVNHLDRDVALLHNECVDDGGWIQFELIGSRSERGATGTQIEVQCNDGVRNGYVVAGDGYMCTDENVVEISLGDAEIQSITVHWPSGLTQVIPDPSDCANQRVTLVENQPVWNNANASRRSDGRLLD
ncbi:FG-GAP-like repeat-containing protein [Rhodopirellula sp. P2]|uniref:FG-GAP-like repeat-containing protein n=1 Tax=Rhodopirellula sp. P2 TaxID=2127060 RepID=UPI002368BFF9|nr:FG-GAP-like repeat-containing protein [Rhodopirellula sp. P2]WDQ15956.1 FG-GAP-like repeat-containing protein [Rhodopirellula sp. P2]